MHTVSSAKIVCKSWARIAHLHGDGDGPGYRDKALRPSLLGSAGAGVGVGAIVGRGGVVGAAWSRASQSGLLWTVVGKDWTYVGLP